MSIIANLKATFNNFFQIGKGGVKLKNDSGNLIIRNNSDGADAQVTASIVNVSGNSLIINSDAIESGSDFKITLTCPSTGMTASYTLTFPVDNGNPLDVLTTDGNGNLSWVSTGITGFTTAINTTSPNNVVNIAQLLANVVSDNGDVVITPKGTGAFILGGIPDGTSTNGNKRGAGAVDLQMETNASSRVASGANSVTAGKNNTASASSSVAMGSGNVSSGSASFTMGQNNTASSANAIAMGNNNSSSGLNGSLAIGSICTASGSFSVALGRYAVSNRLGKLVFASERCSASGDAQTGITVPSFRTTNNTPTTLTADNGAISSSNTLSLNNNSSFLVKAFVIGRTTTANGKMIAYEITALCERGASAGTTAIIGSQVKNTLASKGDVTGWDANLTVNTAQGSIVVEVTGDSSLTVQWVATMYSTENTY